MLDGRKARWFDCDWNNDTGIENACTKCKVCRYLDFVDWAEAAAPYGSYIEYDKQIEAYLKLKTMEEKQKYIEALFDESEGENDE